MSLRGWCESATTGLAEKGVLRVVAITNPLRMGYNTMALIGIKADGKNLLEIADQICGIG